MDNREQTFIDVSHTSPDFGQYGFDLVQVKHDGQWALVTIRDGLAVLTSRKGHELARINRMTPGDHAVPVTPDCTLVGEHMPQQQRGIVAGHMLGGVYIFDCLERGGKDVRDLPYTMRMAHVPQLDSFCISGAMLVKADRCLIDVDISTADAWRAWVMHGGAEGLIYRRSTDPYHGAVIGREKAVQTYDGEYSGQVTAKGLPLFAFVGERPTDTVFQPVRLARCELPGLAAGRIAEFSALARFASGKLRNPMFLRWRNDK